jgi:2-polyprenyl-3-methyl-5-hydroxy-6-metoxy-1,4-benzoquinol methylase
MPEILQQTYNEKLHTEGSVWSANAQGFHHDHVPDWRHLRELNDYWIKRRDFERFLMRIEPGDQVLELGCGSGWLSLEMARRGANVLALDIAEGALAIAAAYYQQVTQTERLAGTVDYRVADINHLESISDRFDWIVLVGTLHHAPTPRELIANCQCLLKPDGRLFVSDPLDTTPLNSLVIGVFLMLLPTNLSYKDKFRHLLRVRGQAVQRMGIAVEGRDLSPFEGVGRNASPLNIVSDFFQIEHYSEKQAVTAFLAQELNAPRWLARTLLRLIAPLDWLLVELKLLRGLRYVLVGIPLRIGAPSPLEGSPKILPLVRSKADGP